jgi:hypothetical protein
MLGISLRTLRNKLREYRAGAPARRPGAASADGQILPDGGDDSGLLAVPLAAPFEEAGGPTSTARSSHLGSRRKEQVA